MKRMKRAVLAMAGAVALTIGTITPAVAGTQETTPSVTSNGARATPVTASAAPAFTVNEVLQFLVLGDGPVEEANPGLAQSLGFVPFPADGDRAAADALIAGYIEAEPKTAAKVTKAVQTGNPVRVDAGLELFAESFNQYVADLYADAAAQVEQSGPGVQPMGSTWAATETWLAAVTTVAGGAWAVVFGAVAGFHVGAAVTVIVVVYLPGMEGGFSTLERDNIVGQLSSALG